MIGCWLELGFILVGRKYNSPSLQSSSYQRQTTILQTQYSQQWLVISNQLKLSIIKVLMELLHSKDERQSFFLNMIIILFTWRNKMRSKRNWCVSVIPQSQIRFHKQRHHQLASGVDWYHSEPRWRLTSELTLLQKMHVDMLLSSHFIFGTAKEILRMHCGGQIRNKLVIIVQ